MNFYLRAILITLSYLIVESIFHQKTFNDTNQEISVNHSDNLNELLSIHHNPFYRKIMLESQHLK